MITQSQSGQIDWDNPLSQNLAVYMPYNEGQGIVVTDLVNGLASDQISPRTPIQWVQSDGYDGWACRFTGASPIYIPATDSLFTVHPVIGYSVWAYFKLDSITPPPPLMLTYLGDTGPNKSTSGFSMNLNFPTMNKFKMTPRNASNQALSVEVAINQVGCVLAGFTVEPTRFSVYANLDAGGMISPIVTLQKQVACSLHNTWFRPAAPQQWVLGGVTSSGGIQSTMPHLNMGAQGAYRERILELVDFQSLLDNPWGVLI